ncbi:unnamed protein product, partial [marine sediment metagenome]
MHTVHPAPGPIGGGSDRIGGGRPPIGGTSARCGILDDRDPGSGLPHLALARSSTWSAAGHIWRSADPEEEDRRKDAGPQCGLS